MSKRQGKGDYLGGSTVVSSDFGFTKLAPSLGTPSSNTIDPPLRQAALKRSAKRKAALAKKKRRKPKRRSRLFAPRS